MKKLGVQVISGAKITATLWSTMSYGSSKVFGLYLMRALARYRSKRVLKMTPVFGGFTCILLLCIVA